MNPLLVLRQAERKSHGAPRLIGGACRCMAAHVVRQSRLTLNGGRKLGMQRIPRPPWLGCYVLAARHLIRSVPVYQLPPLAGHLDGGLCRR
jgi:hypothetical protein